MNGDESSSSLSFPKSFGDEGRKIFVVFFFGEGYEGFKGEGGEQRKRKTSSTWIMKWLHKRLNPSVRWEYNFRLSTYPLPLHEVVVFFG